MTMRAVLELTTRNKPQPSTMGKQRKLKVFAEDLGRNVDRQLQPIERFHESSPAAASRWVQEPAFSCKVAEPPWIAVPLSLSPGSGNDHNLL